jgi:recombinational DNA repair ATPase RecF
MNRTIEIVPAIKRIELHHVGCWEDLKLEFIPGINIITEEGAAWGKTTIFQAILKALIPMSPMAQLEHPTSPTMGFEHGTISVELMSATHKAELLSHDKAFKSLKPQHALESRGKFMLRQLRFYLKAVTPNTAILLEDEVLSSLDAEQYDKAARLLKSSHCQVICLIAHIFELKSLPEARVYACYMQEKNKVGMKLQQLGEGYS